MRMSGNEWRGHWMSPALGGVKDGPGQPVKWIFGLGDSRLDRDAYGLWTVERWALDGLETLEKGGRGKEKKKKAQAQTQTPLQQKKRRSFFQKLHLKK